MARSRNRNFPQRRVTNRSWDLIQTLDTTVAANSQQLVATYALNNAGIDETHLRTVGILTIYSDQVAASESQSGGLGMIVASNQALSVGITAIPHPITDGDDDGWLLFVPFSARLNVGDTTGLQANFGTQYHFDTKAKRVINDGQGIALVIQNFTNFGFVFSLIMRTLTMVRGT